MATATFSVRMDENLKKEFETLCDNFGMNMSTAINVFAKAVVRERKIPFEITNEPIVTTEEALEALKAIREEAIRNGTAGMSLEEINAEIAAARKERREKNK